LIDDSEALDKLGGIASYALVHDREIANRIDDSVARPMDGRIRLLRRARGFAPTPMALPRGFGATPDILAFGGELKSTFCLIKDGKAILSQHQGDLENVATYDDYCKNMGLYAQTYQHRPKIFVVDRHPEYLATKLGLERAREDGATLSETQHHHAHVASCLAENGRPLNAPKVLGIVLDGLGIGDDNEIWGGEFLLSDYRSYQRLATIKPVAMIGGDQASREPWRNLYAHLTSETSWAQLRMKYGGLPVLDALDAKPRATIDAMLKAGLNAPLASSCGRLFDAVAAALGLGWDAQSYEGEAAMKLEALVDPAALRDGGKEAAYPMAITRLNGNGLPYIEPLAMWSAALGDLMLGAPRGKMAARFHKGLARAIVKMAQRLARRDAEEGALFDTIALSGGCFQNRILFELVVENLRAKNFTVLSHEKVPANDGGLALGQAAIGAALQSAA
jgi:hydrogenase maturation protein HypF